MCTCNNKWLPDKCICSVVHAIGMPSTASLLPFLGRIERCSTALPRYSEIMYITATYELSCFSFHEPYLIIYLKDTFVCVSEISDLPNFC